MTVSARSPIGVFDSGIGGLTVVRALMERLPFEDIVYFGDTARVPYGVKSVDTIRSFTTQIADYLLERDVKLLIIACNTMAAVAGEAVRAERAPSLGLGGIAVRPDELLAALEVFSLMFAHLEEAASAYVAANPGTDLKAFYRWASAQTATDEQEMIATLEGIKQEIMNAQAYAIHDRLVEAFDAFSLPMLKVQASCWWSLSHKTLEQVLHSEQVLKAHNVNGRLQGSIHSPLPHRSMIYSDGLLDSFYEVFLQSL